jgi:hypothetical protein
MYKTPILFIIYKNSKVTKAVFDRIREIKPSYLYISSDGPKSLNPDDLLEVERTRKVTENIDWDCKVYRRYSEKNLGCKLGVSSAITWFFEQVEQGIILEYDCLPSTDFFIFCEYLLEKYKYDTRISSITGNNFDNLKPDGSFLPRTSIEYSYYYSSLVKIWGWATWRRAWNNFDLTLSKFTNFSNQNIITTIMSNRKNQEYWMRKIQQVYVGKNKTTWGFIWVFTHFVNRSLCITPSVNLISNIGFNDNGTHARNSEHILSNLPTVEMTIPIISPKHVSIHFENDNKFTNLLIESESKENNIVFLKSLVPMPLVSLYKVIRSYLVSKNIVKSKKGWQL